MLFLFGDDGGSDSVLRQGYKTIKTKEKPNI